VGQRDGNPTPWHLSGASRHGEFVALIGHDDATRVTPQDIVRFKEHLADRGLSGATINRYLSAIKSPLAWAKDNHKIATGAGAKYDAKGGARKKVKRLGYDDNQARIHPIGRAWRDAASSPLDSMGMHFHRLSSPRGCWSQYL
jgi:integrase family protein with SAM-like domain